MAQITIRLGTRGSDLARWQTNHVAQMLVQADPKIKTETVVISTKGDRIIDKPLPLVGGKGLFTAELEAALRGGQIDIAVHSLKDLPTEDPAGLVIGAIPLRVNPGDVLVSRQNYTLATLPQSATVGTSSRRRAAQLLHQRPDLNIIDIRGNIDTRVRKALDPDGPYDAIVLAHAGLLRLKMDDAISETLTTGQMLPAPGQGALGIQCRNEAASLDQLTAVHHLDTALAVAAERGFLAALGSGCSIPVAAYAYRQDSGEFLLEGHVYSVDGSQRISLETCFTANTMSESAQAGSALAAEAISQGADLILEAAQ